MRKDFLLFLSFLVDAGYIVSFRVTGESTTIRKYFEFVEPQKCGAGVAKKLKLSGNGSKN